MKLYMAGMCLKPWFFSIYSLFYIMQEKLSSLKKWLISLGEFSGLSFYKI